MARVAIILVISLCFSSHHVTLTSASEFLKLPTKVLIERVSEKDVRASLLDEVEASLGKGSAASRLAQMEAILAPIVAALPKNERGNLGHSGVRYALHRLFVSRHGWVIKGLGSEGTTHVASPTGLLKDQVPTYIEDLFEQRLAGNGLGLHEVAVLASTIEHLIHNEAVSKLGAAFKVHSLPVASEVSDREAGDVLDTYMMAFILGEDLNTMSLTDVSDLKEQMPQIFLAWHDTQKFVHGIRQNVTQKEGSVNFGSLAMAAEAVGEEFGSFQDFECRGLKEKLMKMEYRGTGRVKLADFYKPALDGSWAFQESVGYLRSLGLLDESDPSQPSVMIANYVNSHANCIASSGYFSVCCKNECESLFGYLEQHISDFEAKPATIVDLVEKLPSGTVAAPQISSSLRQRLDEIAATHGGSVPLHSRLFAQWMHHVYPRECPYPHITGTTDSKVPEEWFVESGSAVTASNEEMMQFVNVKSTNFTHSRGGDLLVEDLTPWSDEEELLVVRPAPLVVTHSTPASVRSACLLAASGSLALVLIQTLKATTLGTESAVIKKYNI